MIRAIDHLVIACPDPDEAATLLESELGLAARGGGRHAGRGSWNRIAWLADGSYLELIGIDDADLASRSPVNAAAVRTLEAGGGLSTYALLVDDLDATVLGLRATGSSFGPRVHGSRTREDGELVEWWTSFPAGPLRPDAVPFLIQHAYVGAEWGAEALEERARLTHPIGSPVRLHGLDVRVEEPVLRAATLHDELQLDVRAVGDRAVTDVGPHVIRLVPAHDQPAAAVVHLTADVDARRSVEALGVRFVVEPAAVNARPAEGR